MSDRIKQIEFEVQEAEREYNATAERLENELQAARKLRDNTIAALMAERDQLALEIKLKEFPKKLVKEHKVCSICGEQMRPFKIANKEGTILKYWACSHGNLQDTHDLIPVE